MVVRGLSGGQRKRLDALVDAHRLSIVPADERRATAFARQTHDRLGQLPLLTSASVKYGVAYDAAHDADKAERAARVIFDSALEKGVTT